MAHAVRGVLAAGGLSTLAAVSIGFGVAILTTDDHLGAATPKDAYVTVAAYRNNPLR